MRVALLLSLVAAICTSSLAAQEIPIQLLQRDFYLKQGFYPEETGTFPPKAGGWKKIVPYADPRALLSYNLFEYKRYKFLFDDELRQSMLLCSFHIERYDASQKSIALYIPHIGDNFEVYLNRHRISSQLFIKNRQMYKEAVAHDLVLELPYHLLNDGFNVLCFRMLGRRGSLTYGISEEGRSFIIGSIASINESLAKRRAQRDMASGAGLFFILVAFIIAVINANRIEYWFFFVLSLLFSCYHLLVFGQLFHLVGTTVFDTALRYILIASIPVLIVFINEWFMLLRVRIHILILSLLYLLLFAALYVFLAPTMLWFVVLIFIYLFVAALVSLSQYAHLVSILLKSEGGAILSLLRILGVDKKFAPLFFYLSSLGSLAYGLFTKEFHQSLYMLYFSFSTLLILSELFRYKLFAAMAGRSQKKVEQLSLELENVRNEYKELLVQADNHREENITLRSRVELLDSNRETDSEVAGIVQKYIFPSTPPIVANYELAIYTESQTKVSGEMYDFYLKQNKLSGVSLFESLAAGLTPGLLTILARSVLFRRFIQLTEEKLNLIFDRINKDFTTELGDMSQPLSGQLLKFVNNNVEYINAGHTDLLYRNGRNGSVKIVSPGDDSYKSSRLGSEISSEASHMLSFTVKTGDMLLLYTDGYLMCRNKQGEPYSLKNIVEVFENIPERKGISELLSYMVKDLTNFRRGAALYDDVTIILLRKIDE